MGKKLQQALPIVNQELQLPVVQFLVRFLVQFQVPRLVQLVSSTMWVLEVLTTAHQVLWKH